MREVKTRRKAADLAPAALADEVQAFLGGHPVSLLIRPDTDGTALITVAPAGTDAEAPEFDEAALLALVDRHVPPARPPDEVDDLDEALAALNAANTVAQVKAALVAWLTKDRDRKGRGRPTRQETRRG
jgi:hypothetical protein